MTTSVQSVLASLPGLTAIAPLPSSLDPPLPTSLTPASPTPTPYRVIGPGWQLIAGSLGPDELRGSAASEILFGFEGDDDLQAKGGDDWIYGGPGKDLLAGGSGDDQIWGEDEDDLIFGDGGRDRLNGGPGNDQIMAGSGDDLVVASPGNDQIDGGEGKDSFDGSIVGQAVRLRYRIDFVPRQIRKAKTEFVAQASLEFSYAQADGGAACLPGTSSLAQKTPGQKTSSQNTPSQPQLQPQLQPQQRRRSKPHQLLEARETHQLQAIETILAPEGKANEIDFSYRRVKSLFEPYGPAEAPAINLDLGQSSLSYSDAAGSLLRNHCLTVRGFRHALGSFGDDWLQGDDQDNRLDGGPGNDQLLGGGGDDQLITHEGDRLTGGAGGDRFLLKTAWRKQISRSTSQAKALEASVITDFNAQQGDRLWLANQRQTSVTLTAEKSLQYMPFADLADGALPAAQFYVLGPGDLGPILSSKFAPQVRLIYNGSSGELFYRGPEVFGKGLDNPQLVAVLAGAPTLTAADFWVI